MRDLIKYKRLNAVFVAATLWVFTGGCADSHESSTEKSPSTPKQPSTLSASLSDAEVQRGELLEVSVPALLSDTTGSWSWLLDGMPCEGKISMDPKSARATLATDSLAMGLHRLRIGHRDTLNNERAANLAFRVYAKSKPISISYEVIKVYPHETDAYTQGLLFRDDVLWESTGLKGKSSLRKVNLETGVPIQSVSLNPEYFAEGLTIFENQLIQLTWQNRLGLVYDLETMELLRTFRYGMEGWGLTHDSTRLYLSDGSSMIYTLDPQSFQMTGNFEVCDHQGAVNQLNELEFRDGRIWANIYGADRIIAFNPLTGEVTHELNLQNLFDRKQYGAYTDVLNGIAFLPESGHMLVTGKLWPSLFELKWSEEAQ